MGYEHLAENEEGGGNPKEAFQWCDAPAVGSQDAVDSTKHKKALAELVAVQKPHGPVELLNM